MRKLLLIVVLSSSGLLFSQTVCTGTTEQCREPQRQVCTHEPAPAKPKLVDSSIVVGSVIDQTGAEFDGGIAVQLRSPGSSELVRTVALIDSKFIHGKCDRAHVGLSTQVTHQREVALKGHGFSRVEKDQKKNGL